MPIFEQVLADTPSLGDGEENWVLWEGVQSVREMMEELAPCQPLQAPGTEYSGSASSLKHQKEPHSLYF